MKGKVIEDLVLANRPGDVRSHDDHFRGTCSRKNNNLKLKESQCKASHVKDNLRNLWRSFLDSSPWKDPHLLECKLSCTTHYKNNIQFPCLGRLFLVVVSMQL